MNKNLQGTISSLTDFFLGTSQHGMLRKFRKVTTYVAELEATRDSDANMLVQCSEHIEVQNRYITALESRIASLEKLVSCYERLEELN